MSDSNDPELAANLIRQKLTDLYEDEPNAKQELREAKDSTHRSKHQQYMYDLSNSGKSLAEIQTAWHAYYQGLSDNDKHQVWHEFYREYDRQHATTPHPHAPAVPTEQRNPLYQQAAGTKAVTYTAAEPATPQTVASLKRQLLGNVRKRATKTSAKEHLKSLGFGLACGFVALVIFLFGFFNERFIAPFITPSRSVSNAPIVIDASTAAAGPEPLLIIPKINLQVPVVYTEPSTEEAAVETALESGVVHYASTPYPGEKGNGVIFGHSSNNIFNKGKYKFAFSLLRRLEVGDTFTLQKDSKRYVYKVFDKKIVAPKEVSVLNNQTKPATFTLITCDPPGTSLNRLVVVGEQISPDPAANTASTAATDQPLPGTLPSNAPTLWSRFVDWLTR